MASRTRIIRDTGPMSDGLVRLLSACVSLLPLGLAMGFSPTLYAYTVRELSTRTPASAAERSVRWATLGLVLGALAQIALFRLVDPETIIGVLRLRVEDVLVTAWVDRVAGAVLLLAGIAALLLLSARRDDPRSSKFPRPEHVTPRHLIAIGMLGTVGVSDVATAYVAGRMTASASPDLVLELLPLLAFLAVTAAPYLFLAAAWHRVPPLARAVTGAFDALTRIDRRPLEVVALLLAGGVFLAMGIWGAPDIAALLHRR